MRTPINAREEREWRKKEEERRTDNQRQGLNYQSDVHQESNATQQGELNGPTSASKVRDSHASGAYHPDKANSDDEYGVSSKEEDGKRPLLVGPGRQFHDDLSFVNGLRQYKGWELVPMGNDGACMFRAIAFHMTGDQEMHMMVRERCIDYMRKNRDHFEEFVAEDYETYLARKSDPRCHGNHLELHAMSELFFRNIEVYSYSTEPINTFSAPASSSTSASSRTTTNPPIRISYHGNVHYNAILDPNMSTFGVGWGMTDLDQQAGSADRQQVNQAVHASEADIVEQALLQQSLLMSDQEFVEEQMMQASDQEYIEQQILQAQIEEAIRLESLQQHHSRESSSSSVGATKPKPKPNDVAR